MLSVDIDSHTSIPRTLPGWIHVPRVKLCLISVLLQARQLFRKFISFPPNISSYSTRQFSVLLASMMSLWVPEEIPIVVEVLFECLIDKDLVDYLSHICCVLCLWFNNIWAPEIVCSHSPPDFVEYGWICAQLKLRQSLTKYKNRNTNYKRRKNKRRANQQYLHLSGQHIVTKLCEVLCVLRARHAAVCADRRVCTHAGSADLKRAASLGLFVGNSKFNYVRCLERLDLPVLMEQGTHFTSQMFRLLGAMPAIPYSLVGPGSPKDYVTESERILRIINRSPESQTNTLQKFHNSE
eukprot:523173_1